MYQRHDKSARAPDAKIGLVVWTIYNSGDTPQNRHTITCDAPNFLLTHNHPYFILCPSKR